DYQVLDSFPTRRSSDLQKGFHVRLPQVNKLCEEPASVGACASSGAIGVDSKNYEGRWFFVNTGFELKNHQGELPSSRTRPKDARSEEHTSELQSRENLV